VPESSVGVGELGLVVSAGRLLGFSRSWGEGNRRLWRRGTGDAVTPSRCRQAGRRASGVRGSRGSNQVDMFTESRSDRSIGGSWAMGFNCSVVELKPPKENCRCQARALAYIHAARTQPLSTLSLHRHLHRHHLIIIKKLGS